MNNLAPIPQAVPYSPTTFEAFHIADGLDARWNTTALGAVEGTTLDEALASTLCGHNFTHKDHLLIRQSGSDPWGEPRTTLHLFAIKKKTQPEYVYRDYAYQRHHRLYAAPVCSIVADILNQSEKKGQVR